MNKTKLIDYVLGTIFMVALGAMLGYVYVMKTGGF
jgi:hypothetical protein